MAEIQLFEVIIPLFSQKTPEKVMKYIIEKDIGIVSHSQRDNLGSEEISLLIETTTFQKTLTYHYF